MSNPPIEHRDALKAIREMEQVINPEEDYLAVVAISDAIKRHDERRQRQIDEMSAKLKVLLKALEAAQASCVRPPAVPSEEDHLKTMNDLDGTRMALAKTISDFEIKLTESNAQAVALRKEADALQAYDPPTEQAKELDGDVARLAIYRGLGLEPISDNTGHERMLVRSQSGDIHILEFPQRTAEIEGFDDVQRYWHTASL
ncbi:hypothetical protein FISHEDRAFT_71335 [Fistulina hepatica ATCC 64428]|nr:hypothetical protein FISHEDRAFT_71335 [Fistulina hepatica ATCC 64428]